MVTALALLVAAAAPASDVPIAATLPPVEASMPAIVPPDVGFFQVVIEQQIIIRVPAQRSPINNFAAPAPPPQPVRPREAQVVWKEKKGPRCVAMKNIVRMEAVQRDSIDLITRQKQLLRAQLNRGCRALDFYAGFYMKGNKDGQLCKGRDEIHARTGAKCEVDEFRLLVPVARDDD